MEEKEKEKEKEKGEEETSEVQKKQLVIKSKERIASFLAAKRERRRERKERQKQRQTHQNETSLGEVWMTALSPCAFGTELNLCQSCSSRPAGKDGDDGKVAAAASSSERPGGWRRFHKGVEAARRKAKMLRCTLLNGSAWSAEGKCMRRYKRKCEIFF